MNSSISPLLPIEMHVHLVGNGLRGSGCWLLLAAPAQLLPWWAIRKTLTLRVGAVHAGKVQKYSPDPFR